MTALSLQVGAKSLISIGIGLGDIAALVQHGRTFGNWLRTGQNDQELFETISEDYGVVLKRRGLLDTILMENRWAHQLHLIHHGHVVHDSAKSRREGDKHLGNFSWFMVVLVTVLDVCLTSMETRDLLVQTFVRLLHRDDSQDLTESLQMQLQTNIESWRSVGSVRGMVPILSASIKNSRAALVGTTAIPLLARGENVELCELLHWLMAGETSHYRVISATVYSLAEGLSCAGIQIELGVSEQLLDGPITIQYAGQVGGMREFFNIMESDLNFRTNPTENNLVPPQRVSYLCGRPFQIIDTFPRPSSVKEHMARYWFRGAEAAEQVKIIATAPLKILGIIYAVACHDECTSSWDTTLSLWSEEHFPVESEILMRALSNLMGEAPRELKKWLCHCVNVGGQLDDLQVNFSEQQIDLFLYYQSLVFGYWYKLVEPWVSMEFVKEEIYFYGVWGFRDIYLLDMLRKLAKKFRCKVCYDEGPGREDLLRVLSVMFAGRHTYKPPKSANKLESGHGLMAILDNISVVSLSLLKPSDSSNDVARFAIVPLPVIGLLPNQNGELWAGKADGIQFRSCQRPSSQLVRMLPRKDWSIHAKMSTTDGRLSKVVMVARCGGVVVGTFNPSEADGALIRARANHCGNWGARMALASRINARRQPTPSDLPPETPLSTFDASEDQFQAGVICRPYGHGQLVIVHSHGCPAMRYAAAGFYAHESHITLTEQSLEESIKAIKEQFTQPVARYLSGIIID